MRTRPLLLPVLLALALTTHAAAQVPEPVTEPSDAPLPPPEPSLIIKADTDSTAGSATKGRDSAGRDTLSVDFPNEDIRTILSNVGDLFELNLVIPETLQGRTTIKLRDVTWRQIFEVVLAPVGYSYVEEGNIIKVLSNETLQMEPVSTEVFILNFARASDILPTLSSLVDPAAGGRIVVDGRSNALVVTERPSRMNRIRPILEQLDRATDQVMIETKFVEVTDRAVKNLGVNWASLGGYEISGGALQQNFTNTRGRETSAGRTETNIDVPFMQNGFERADTLAARNGAGPNTDPNTGIGPPFTINPDTGGRSYADLGPASEISQLFTGNLQRVTSAVFSAEDFRVVLSALQTQNDTKIVSNPTVVTLNNVEATINVGEEFPIPSYTYNQERGTFEVSGFEYRPIGINLKVTPQVNAAGFIKLTVEPEVSQRAGESTFSGAEIPIIATRKAKTQVSLKDGYTMGIGGLIRKESGAGSSKVPVLGSVPVFGRLFRSETKSETVSNLLIFITARSVAADGAPVEEIFDPRQIRQLNMTRDDLPGYRDGSDPFVAPVVPEEKPARRR